MADDAFRKHLEIHLKEDLPHKAQALMGAYDQTLSYLDDNIYAEIRAAEPDLTDHGLKHISNVQRNVLALLQNREGGLIDISGTELYCLAMATLFHDVGNIRGRIGHHKNIGQIYDKARGTGMTIRREKTLVIRACAAHTGKTRDGSRDTLRELSEHDDFEGKPVRLRQVAAILRFADELAEGPQRTSEYRLRRDGYAADARVYQEYASVTHIHIDRGNRRISLAYEIPVDDEEGPGQRQESLKELIAHILDRIVKLDQERRYAAHYAPVLSEFKATRASFTFHCGSGLLDFDLPDIVLDDLTIPGSDAEPIEKGDPIFSPEDLAARLIEQCRQAGESS
ncbi:MAG: hypothetical protein OXF72_08285 [Gammaproteobacteria bacterium]|nr:hypothetical protein [Gammaproteobacteria bacterium]